MRRNIVHPGADSLTYEIRAIVAVGKRMESMGMEISWENIGDPIVKGEVVAPWIKEKAMEVMSDCESWGYCDSKGGEDTREFLAGLVNQRPGQVKINADDILFFNGLGDAISTIFSNMRREARILGPSPAYSTHSSGEAAHSGYEHLTYRCDRKKNWLPDIEDIRNKVRYNDTITGLLLISPNNPTGSVYPRHVLEALVDIAREYDLMIINDEIYSNIVYNGAEKVHLSEVVGKDVPAMSLRGISKEFPWPGSRCGWIEVYNRDKDATFDRYIKSLADAKMMEVCCTTLPQMVIPKVMGDPRYPGHLEERAKMFEQRSNEAMEILSCIKGVQAIKPQGAFYMTVVFEDGVLNQAQSLPAHSAAMRSYMEELIQPGLALDHRFVYHLMASKGICVVPLSSFCCDEMGFRFTILESDPEKRRSVFQGMADGIREYLGSC
jgi:aspartate/methionine/tyrosine aminotransferase